jgi:hypothetical protein
MGPDDITTQLRSRSLSGIESEDGDVAITAQPIASRRTTQCTRANPLSVRVMALVWSERGDFKA